MSSPASVIVQKRIRHALSVTEPSIMALKIFCIFFFILNAYGVAWIGAQGVHGLSSRILINYTNVALFIAAIFKDFVPQIKTSFVPIPNYYPVSDTQRVLMVLSSGLVNFANIAFGIYLLSLLIFSPSNLSIIAEGGLLVCLGGMLSIWIRMLLFSSRNRSILILVSFLQPILIIVLVLNKNGVNTELSVGLISISLLLLLWMIKDRIIASKYDTLTRASFQFLTLLSSRRNIKKAMILKPGKTLIIGFCLKAAILSCNALFIIKKGKNVFDSEVLFNLFLSPVILFSYVFNNLFGFIHTLTNNLLYRNKNVFRLVYLYFSMLWLPVLIDVIITFSTYVIIKGSIDISFVAQYSTQLSLLVSFGLFSSFRHAIKVRDILSFKTFYYTYPPITISEILLMLLVSMKGAQTYYFVGWLVSLSVVVATLKNKEKYKYHIISNLS